MSSFTFLFTGTRLQTCTYLLAVCPFSIAFLVFVNSSVSFVVTDLIGLRDGEGDAVGTLGFADELLALVACPIWGLISDRVGVRHVCTVGYAIIAIAFVVFVHAQNVYPHLLFGRLLFTIGGSAVSTMVTAILPVLTARHALSKRYTSSVSSELTITAERFVDHRKKASGSMTGSPSSRLAGFVGTCAGCGALVSLALFLPLPARFQKMGFSPAQAIQFSYYLVAGVAILVSVCCFIGLRNLHGEQDEDWNALFHSSAVVQRSDANEAVEHGRTLTSSYWSQLGTALVLGFRSRDIALGYIGGFVARASSVAISLFIPLLVNHYYRMSGLCEDDAARPLDSNLGDIKKSCSKAYILASILTGVSQLVALLAAPVFGFPSERFQRFHVPLIFASLSGIAGYLSVTLLPSPEFKGQHGNAGVFIIMGLIGISQIGAIVCSLAILSNGILSIHLGKGSGQRALSTYPELREQNDDARQNSEDQPLLDAPLSWNSQQLSQIKGAVAGVYSLWGGAGILLLTKVGGLLFDTASVGAPFYFIACFNGILLAAGIICGIPCIWSRDLEPCRPST